MNGMTRRTIASLLFAVLFVYNVFADETSSEIIIPSATVTPHQLDVAYLTINWTQLSQIELDSLLYVRIDSTLSLARSVNDTLEAIHTYRYAHLDQLTAIWSGDSRPASWLEGGLESGDPYIDSLGSALGLIEVVVDESDQSEFRLYFDRLINPERAAEAYRRSEFVSSFAVMNTEDNSDTYSTSIGLRMYATQMCYVFIRTDLTYFNAEGERDEIRWFVSVDGDQLSYDGRTESDLGDISIYNSEMQFRFDDVYVEIDSLFSDLSPDALWWHREYALNAVYYCFPTYGSIIWHAQNEISLADKSVLNSGLVKDANGSIRVAASVGDEDRPTRGLEHLITLHVEEVAEALAADTLDPDSGFAWTAREMYSRYVIYIENAEPYLQPYPFHLWAPDSAYRHAWVDTLEWEWAYQADSADYFDYLVTVYKSWEGKLGVVRTDSTWITLQSLKAQFGLEKENHYEVKVEAERNASADTTFGDWYTFMVSDYGPPKPYEILEPQDGEVIPYSALEDFTLRWSSSQYPGWPEQAFYDPHLFISLTDSTYRTVRLGGYLVDTTLTLDLRSSIYPNSLEDTELSVEISVFSYHNFVYAPFSGGNTGWASIDVTIDFVEGMEEEERGFPQVFTISRSYPNPFNPTATVVMVMPERARLKLEVFNLLGQRVAVLADGVVPQGWRNYVFDGTGLASGVYIVRATVPGQLEQSKRITLVR